MRRILLPLVALAAVAAIAVARADDKKKPAYDVAVVSMSVCKPHGAKGPACRMKPATNMRRRQQSLIGVSEGCARQLESLQHSSRSAGDRRVVE